MCMLLNRQLLLLRCWAAEAVITATHRKRMLSPTVHYYTVCNQTEWQNSWRPQQLPAPTEEFTVWYCESQNLPSSSSLSSSTNFIATQVLQKLQGRCVSRVSQVSMVLLPVLCVAAVHLSITLQLFSYFQNFFTVVLSVKFSTKPMPHFYYTLNVSLCYLVKFKISPSSVTGFTEHYLKINILYFNVILL